MVIEVIRCPSCGGDMDVDPSSPIIECPYCNSDIVNDRVSRFNSEIVRLLIGAKNALESGNIAECRDYLSKASYLEQDCSDIWYMQASLNSADVNRFKYDCMRAEAAKKSFGVFTKADAERHWNKRSSEHTKGIMFWFMIGAFIILFFGGTLSLVFGIAFGSFFPVLITFALIFILFVVCLVCIGISKSVRSI